MTRPTWDEYFMEVMEAISKRATCDRGKSGCVIVSPDHQIISTGYVGSPKGLPHCDEAGHYLKTVKHSEEKSSTHCVRTVHAEANAICQAAKQGASTDGGILYCRMTPCRTCAMLIINCGIRKVIVQKRYHDGEDSIEMFRLAGVEFIVLSDEVQNYTDQ